MRLVVAVTGASGAIYALRLLRTCLGLGASIELLVTDYGKRLLIEESDLNIKTTSVEDWISRNYGEFQQRGSITLHNVNDLGSSIASGSQHWEAMIVIPCSMKTLAGIANGTASNLVERAADVTLKEHRPLVLVPRETPLNLIQIENMARAARAGAMIVPAMPAFYLKPTSLEDLADFVVGRVLSVLGIEHELFQPWKS